MSNTTKLQPPKQLQGSSCGVAVRGFDTLGRGDPAWLWGEPAACWGLAQCPTGSKCWRPPAHTKPGVLAGASLHLKHPCKLKKLGLHTSAPTAASLSSVSMTQHSHPTAQLSPNAMFIEDF